MPEDPRDPLCPEDAAAQLAALQRITADLDEHHRRLLQRSTAEQDRTAVEVLRELLPVLDAVESGARRHPGDLAAVHDRLQRSVAESGLRRIDPLGEPFDPAEHEIAGDGGEAPGPTAERGAVVAEVVRAGYRAHGHLVRRALVRLSRGP